MYLRSEDPLPTQFHVVEVEERLIYDRASAVAEPQLPDSDGNDSDGSLPRRIWRPPIYPMEFATIATNDGDEFDVELDRLQNTQELADFRAGSTAQAMYSKDGRVLAYLYDGATLGNFTAYSRMVVTDAGVTAGLLVAESNILMSAGDRVAAPWSRQRKQVREQMEPRAGVLCRVLLGNTATGSTKSAATQQRLLYLCLVERQALWRERSRFQSEEGGEEYTDTPRITDL